jgi:hypothetical protein
MRRDIVKFTLTRETPKTNQLPYVRLNSLRTMDSILELDSQGKVMEMSMSTVTLVKRYQRNAILESTILDIA